MNNTGMKPGSVSILASWQWMGVIITMLVSVIIATGSTYFAVDARIRESIKMYAESNDRALADIRESIKLLVARADKPTEVPVWLSAAVQENKAELKEFRREWVAMQVAITNLTAATQDLQKHLHAIEGKP